MTWKVQDPSWWHEDGVWSADVTVTLQAGDYENAFPAVKDLLALTRNTRLWRLDITVYVDTSTDDAFDINRIIAGQFNLTRVRKIRHLEDATIRRLAQTANEFALASSLFTSVNICATDTPRTLSQRPADLLRAKT